jgi:hypothetical protein
MAFTGTSPVLSTYRGNILNKVINHDFWLPGASAPCSGCSGYRYCRLYYHVLKNVSCSLHFPCMAVSAAFRYGYLKFISTYKWRPDQIFSIVTGLQPGGTGVRIAACPRLSFCSQKRQYRLWVPFGFLFRGGTLFLSTRWINWGLILTIISS